MEFFNVNYCRICLIECDELDSDTGLFVIPYRALTGHIIADDDIPKKVCGKCQTDIFYLKDFLEKCEKTEKILKGYQHRFNNFIAIGAFKSEDIESAIDILDVKPDLEVEVYDIKNEPSEVFGPAQLEINTNKEKQKKIPVKQKKNIRFLCCELCGKQIQSYAMKKHLLIHENKSNKNSHVCDICGAIYSSKEVIRRHMHKKHLKLVKYECTFCGKVYTDLSNLKSHMMYRHTRDFPIVCEVCGKGFHSKSKLEVHHSKHTDIRKYPCNICGDAFKSRHYLGRHRRDVHTNRNINCQECGKSFKCQKLLHQHQKFHRPHEFLCPLCSQSFSVGQTLRNHITKNHPELSLPPPGTNLRNLKDLNSYLMLCTTTSLGII